MENTGSRALETAIEFRPDLIFLDIVMPDADGASLASEISEDPVLRNTPVVFLTGLLSKHESGGGSLKIGGRLFLAKPVDPDTILAYIDKHAVSQVRNDSST